MKTNSVAEYASTGYSGRGSLGKMVDELKRQLSTSVSFIVDTRTIVIENVEGRLMLAPNHKNPEFYGPVLSWFKQASVPIQLSSGDFIHNRIPLTKNALQQMAERGFNPAAPFSWLAKYADEWPERAAEWLTEYMHDTAGSDGKKAKRLIRCLDGSCRAFLSERFRVIDHLDMLKPSLAKAMELGAKPLEASLSESHMRVKLVDTSVWDVIEQRRMDGSKDWYAGGLGNQSYLSKVHANSVGALPGGPGTVHPIISLANSETGHGRFRVRLGILGAVCFNLATVEDVIVQMHLGSKQEVGILSQETIRMENEVIVAKALDAIEAAFTESKFREIVKTMRASQNVPVEAPKSAMENIVKVSEHINDGDLDGLVNHFMRDYDNTIYGVGQAVSRLAQDVEDGDRASDIESLAGDIMMQRGKVYTAIRQAA